MSAAARRRPVRVRVVAYYLEGIDRVIYERVRLKAGGEGRSVAWLLRQALREYADGSWAPQTTEGRP